MNNGNHMALFSASEMRSSRMRLCMWTRWLAIGPVKGNIKGEPSRSSTMAPVGRNGIQNKHLLLFTLFLVLFVINKNRPLKIAKTRPLDMKNTHIIRLAISLVRSKLTQNLYIYIKEEVVPSICIGDVINKADLCSKIYQICIRHELTWTNLLTWFGKQ